MLTLFVKFEKFIKYNMSSVVATLIDLFALWAFTELLGIYYLISAVLAFSIGTVTNYSLNRYWNFKSTKKSFLRGLTSFAIIGLSSLILTTILLYVFVEFFGIHYLVGKILTTLLAVIWNFKLVSKITFSDSN